MSLNNVLAVINVLRNAQGAVKTAIQVVNEYKANSAGPVLNSVSEEELEVEIKKLEDMLPDLRRATQDKLRG